MILDENKIVETYAELFGYEYDYDELYDDAMEKFVGEFFTHAELGEHFVENGALEIPENVLPYFDYQAFGRDLDWGGDVSELNNLWFWSY